MVALASAVERSQESDAVQQASLEAAAAAATAAKAAAADAVNAFRRQLDEVKATAEAAAAEDKALDRAWRRDVVAAEPHSEALLRLFRVRKRPEEKVRPWPAVITVCALTEPKRRFGWSPLTVVPLLVFSPPAKHTVSVTLRRPHSLHPKSTGFWFWVAAARDPFHGLLSTLTVARSLTATGDCWATTYVHRGSHSSPGSHGGRGVASSSGASRAGWESVGWQWCCARSVHGASGAAHGRCACCRCVAGE